MYDVAVAAAGAPGQAAAVVATGPGTWAVSTADGITPVSPPRARRPRSATARLGEHTRSVLDGLGGGACAPPGRRPRGGPVPALAPGGPYRAALRVCRSR